MIIDAFAQFDSAFNYAQANATYTSANVLDLHMAGIPVLVSGQGARDLGIGDDPALKLVVQVLTTCTGATSTLVVNLQGSPDNGAGSPLSFTTYLASQTIAVANLVAGARILDVDVPRPPPGVAFPRFLRLQYVIGTAAGTAGTIESFLVLDRHDQPLQANATLGGYPAGITVSN